MSEKTLHRDPRTVIYREHMPFYAFASTKINALAATVEPIYRAVTDPGHEWSHVGRVVDWATRMALDENADVEIVQAAALLHDIVNVPKNHPDRAHASAWAAQKAAEYLTPIGFSQSSIERIGQAILEHSFSRALTPTSIESACVQDADRLDAIGAIGVFRTAACGTLMKGAFYSENEPFFKESTIRKLDDRRFMIDHFYVKLLKLETGFNTRLGKVEARRRTQFLKAYLDQLQSEVSGLN